MKTIDRVARWLLAGIAFLLSAPARIDHSYLSLLMVPFMITVLFAPFSKRMTAPTWLRYAIYGVLFVAYLALWDIKYPTP